MIKEFVNKAKEKITQTGKVKLCMESQRNFKKRIGIKFFYESKGTTDYTKLIRTNTAYESQSYIPTEYKSSADKKMYTYQSSVRW